MLLKEIRCILYKKFDYRKVLKKKFNGRFDGLIEFKY